MCCHVKLLGEFLLPPPYSVLPTACAAGNLYRRQGGRMQRHLLRVEQLGYVDPRTSRQSNLSLQL